MIKSGSYFEKLGAKCRYPISVFLELTYRCNWGCEHCYTVEQDDETMKAGEWEMLIEELRKLSVLILVFTGGEPMMHPRFSSLPRRPVKRGLP